MAIISKIQTNNAVYNLKDGRIPDIPDDATTFLRGDGTWAAPTVSVTTSESNIMDDSTGVIITPSMGYVLLGQKAVTANTSSTTEASLDDITVASAWTKSKIIYVRIRDMDSNAPRDGYFYGSDCFFVNYQLGNGTSSALTYGSRIIHRYSGGVWSQYPVGATTGYGVYAYDINSSGRVRIYTRYDATYSLTINGTYLCEVYALDWPDGVSPYGA